MSKKKDRSLFPPLPESLPASVIDNHTHVGPDRPGQEQNVVDGQWKYPLLIDGQVAAMKQVGVSAAITVGCEIPDLDEAISLAQSDESFYAAIAIHPNEAPLHAGILEVGPDGLEPRTSPHHSLSLDEAVAEVAKRATADRVVAIGETGLDYFRTAEEGRLAQQECFRAHIALAKELDLPLQIHDREAHADTVRILEEEGAPERTVFHCFSGDAELAGVLADNGWYASFAGTVTFPRNEDLRAAARVLPEQLIMVETDAPYLTAHPMRGRPNAPYLVAHTVRHLAEVREVDLGSWCERLTETTREVYGLD
ncbi:MAG: TatD family hydrolase [Flaviflexus sp.]|nr:TatD family hydrolase [Flaviflexus sp.]